MAKNDIPWEWAHSTGPTLTERTRVTFISPEGSRSEVIVPYRIGPPTPYFGMDENMAEILELKRQNAARAARKPEVPFTKFGSARQVMDDIEANLYPKPQPNPNPRPFWPKQPDRPYMAGLGRFLTAARLAEQMAGEQPYSYALNNPVTYVDPEGLAPQRKRPGAGGSGCTVKVCSQYGFTGQGILSGIVSHQYVCLTLRNGRSCVGGLNPGKGGNFGGGMIGDQIKSCGNSSMGGFPTVCETISTSCANAVGVCSCIAQFTANPPTYFFGWHQCTDFKYDIEDCLEDLGLGINSLGPLYPPIDG